MPLALPPRSAIRCDDASAKLVHAQLTSVIAGHPQARTTYQFYEELDAWLGPWGNNGYPLAYGRFYNRAFTGNERLMADPVAAEWVRVATIRLQEALRDFVVARVRACTLRSITEPELRQAAFISHPNAYDSAGLSRVMLVAPELTFVVMVIPGKEFLPTAENFGPTVKQLLETAARMSPQVSGSVLAALAGPAHNGLFRLASARDRQRDIDETAVRRELFALERAVQEGRLDHAPLLDLVVEQLNATEFDNPSAQEYARRIVQLAETRRRALRTNYNRMLEDSPDVKRAIERAFPRLLRH